MKAEAFVIHLARAGQRRPQVDALLSRLPLPVHVIDAVDGNTLDQATARAVYRKDLHRPRYPFELRMTEIACFLSHRQAWREIVERKLDAGLIVEDDVEPDDALFARALKVAGGVLQPLDYIRFPYRAHTDAGRLIAGQDGISVIEPKLPGLGMQMQLVGHAAAAALLKQTEIFDRPVDTTIQMRWLSKVRVLAARPVCIREIGGQLGGTVVQKKAKPAGEVIAREVKRAAYRLKLAVTAARR